MERYIVTGMGVLKLEKDPSRKPSSVFSRFRALFIGLLIIFVFGEIPLYISSIYYHFPYFKESTILIGLFLIVGSIRESNIILNGINEIIISGENITLKTYRNSETVPRDQLIASVSIFDNLNQIPVIGRYKLKYRKRSFIIFPSKELLKHLSALPQFHDVFPNQK